MLKANRKAMTIWFFAFIGIIMLVNFTYRDTYLRLYWMVIFIFVTWCLMCIQKRIINTLVVFSIFYFILFAFGPMLLYKQGFDYYKSVGDYIIISYLFFVVGYCFSGRKTLKLKLFSIFQPSNNYNTIYVISIVVFLVGMISYCIYFVNNWHNIFVADFNSGRVDAMKGNGIFLWLGSLVWLSVYMVYEQFLINGHYKKSTYSMFIIAAFFSILLGFRSALVNPILVMFFMKNKKEEIPLKRMGILAVALMIFVGVYGAVRSNDSSTVDSLLNEFKVSSVNLNYIFEYFPNKVNFQMGKTYLLDFVRLVDDNVEGTTSWLKKVIGLHFSGGGITPTLIGEFYINFGFIGVLIGMLLSGSVFKRIELSYRKQSNSLFLCCLFLGYIRPIIRGGWANSIVNLLFYIIGYCGCQFVARKLKIRFVL